MSGLETALSYIARLWHEARMTDLPTLLPAAKSTGEGGENVRLRTLSLCQAVSTYD